jgi:ligand-binding sensor domain-containing protein
MDSKFYVSLEAEELLKEKGYPFVLGYDSIHPRKVTKAEAIDWLESKGKIIEVLQDYRGQWFYVIKEVCVSEDNNTYFSTRLEAEDAAIIKACELLTNEN